MAITFDSGTGLYALRFGKITDARPKVIANHAVRKPESWQGVDLFTLNKPPREAGRLTVREPLPLDQPDRPAFEASGIVRDPQTAVKLAKLLGIPVARVQEPARKTSLGPAAKSPAPVLAPQLPEPRVFWIKPNLTNQWDRKRLGKLLGVDIPPLTRKEALMLTVVSGAATLSRPEIDLGFDAKKRQLGLALHADTGLNMRKPADVSWHLIRVPRQAATTSKPHVVVWDSGFKSVHTAYEEMLQTARSARKPDADSAPRPQASAAKRQPIWLRVLMAPINAASWVVNGS